MAMWINGIGNVTYFGDPRVYHGVSADAPILQQYPNICSNFLALHGSYPVQLEQYWQRMLLTRTKKYTVPGIIYPCGNVDKTYNYRIFKIKYRHEPIPCRDSPVWTLGEMHVGRDGRKDLN